MKDGADSSETSIHLHQKTTCHIPETAIFRFTIANLSILALKHLFKKYCNLQRLILRMTYNFVLSMKTLKIVTWACMHRSVGKAVTCAEFCWILLSS